MSRRRARRARRFRPIWEPESRGSAHPPAAALPLAALRPAFAASPLAAAPAESDEEELVRRSRMGDPEAFSVLVQLYQHRVFRLASRFFERREDVEEVAQETFLRAWSKLHTYKAKAPFEHWLVRLCLNCCHGLLRRRRRTEQLATDWDVAGAPHDPADALEIRKLLARLAPKDRFLLVLLDAEGYSIAEAADRLGWSRINVRVRAFRARKRLRLLLEEGLA